MRFSLKSSAIKTPLGDKRLFCFAITLILLEQAPPSVQNREAHGRAFLFVMSEKILGKNFRDDVALHRNTVSF
jgi:hypothetical protein